MPCSIAVQGVPETRISTKICTRQRVSLLQNKFKKGTTLQMLNNKMLKQMYKINNKSHICCLKAIFLNTFAVFPSNEQAYQTHSIRPSCLLGHLICTGTDHLAIARGRADVSSGKTKPFQW